MYRASVRVILSLWYIAYVGDKTLSQLLSDHLGLPVVQFATSDLGKALHGVVRDG